MASRALNSMLPATPRTRRGAVAEPGAIYVEHSVHVGATLNDTSCLKEVNGNGRPLNNTSASAMATAIGAAEKSNPKSKSSTSFISLLGRDKTAAASQHREKPENKPLKKSKSSTSLSALVTRSKSLRGAKSRKDQDRDLEAKENEVNIAASEAAAPPIWAQFATQDSSTPARIALNDNAISQQARQGAAQGHGSRHKATLSEPFVRSPNKSDDQRQSREAFHAKPNPEKPSSRVQAAVAAFNDKSKPLPSAPISTSLTTPLDPQAVAEAFESLLDTRNVPEATRDKMRALDVSIKADLIKQDKSGSRPGTSAGTSDLGSDCSHSSRGSRGSAVEDAEQHNDADSVVGETPRKSRPRSLTFTFSKGDQSPAKKQKSSSRNRSKSRERIKLGSRLPSQTDLSKSISGVVRSEKTASPDQYVSFLHKCQSPKTVEVSKIQKLQQLLRNESVGWVDDFVKQKGMHALTELLYRTMEIEWREEQEDNLLHNLLLCLKALCTTSSAMAELSVTQSTLFPKLLTMLFDEERKGPSEYTTRTLIMVILFNYLSLSLSGSPAERASTLLSYLRDPSPPEAAQPPGFIASIYHPRPFRVWKKELDNLTKEVFWIFLHHTNIIPFPSTLPNSDSSTYLERHFPPEHSPRPAAPHIGGVEWEATNYVTAHLDLLNGLLASLPTLDERNATRQLLRDSGFEKVMGGYLRTCKEKFYGSVHESLTTWLGAAREDDWPTKDVREGPPREEVIQSPKKVAAAGGKRKKDNGEGDAPKLGGLMFDVGPPPASKSQKTDDDAGWF